jgi:hypothetical protein
MRPSSMGRNCRNRRGPTGVEMLKHRLAALFLGVALGAVPAAAQEKVILDSDYTTIGDDGQVGVMAMQLHAQGVSGETR